MIPTSLKWRLNKDALFRSMKSGVKEAPPPKKGCLENDDSSKKKKNYCTWTKFETRLLKKTKNKEIKSDKQK